MEEKILTPIAFELDMENILRGAPNHRFNAVTRITESHTALLSLARHQNEVMETYIQDYGHESDCGTFSVRDCDCFIKRLSTLVASFPDHLQE